MKSHQKIKEQIAFWFLKYHGKSDAEVSGREIFTMVEKLPKTRQERVYKEIDLENGEMPVLYFQVSDDEYIVNTTTRFVRSDAGAISSIPYKNFDRHVGFKSPVIDPKTGQPVSVKKSGFLSEFGIKTKEKKVIYWRIPSGRPAFAFWNVTEKCELVGRKYL